MRVSTRIIITYATLGTSLAALSGILAYLLWIYEPIPGTLEALMKPVGLAFLILIGIVQAAFAFADPLARRVVRRLRYKGQ